jgi:hypothetical protein
MTSGHRYYPDHPWASVAFAKDTNAGGSLTPR